MKTQLHYLALLSLLWSALLQAEPAPELIYNLKGTVVKIHTVTKSGGQGSGSGVVVAENLVATNCHVLANSVGSNISAMGETYQPIGVRADWKHDVCIMHFAFLPLKPAVLGDSEQLFYEAATFSVGFPGGPPKPITTTGKIKALYAMDDSYIIRTSASFQIGASGSPLFNEQGQLIGMNTFKSPSKTNHFYNVPVKWIKSAMTLPETELVEQGDSPFWDAPLNQKPYWMQVVLPAQAEQWSELLQIASAWLKQSPNDAEAYYYFALAEQHLGKPLEAKTKFKKVLSLNPHHTNAVLALAKIAKTEKNTAELNKLQQQLSLLDEDASESLNEIKP
jgi:serine protease Do